jgi:hypothetical protein
VESSAQIREGLDLRAAAFGIQLSSPARQEPGALYAVGRFPFAGQTAGQVEATRLNP